MTLTTAARCAPWPAPRLLAIIGLTVLPFATACGSAAPAASGTSSSPAVSPTSSPTATPPDPRDLSTWHSGPGFIGPIKAGMSAQDLQRQGFVTRHGGQACDLRWDATSLLTKAGVYLEFRSGSPDDLDAVSAGDPTKNGDTFSTAEGIGVGTSVATLRAAYSDLRYGEYQGEGGLSVGWSRTTSAGSIYFNVGAKDVAHHWIVGDGTKVNQIQATSATDPSAFAPDGGGC